MTSSLVKITDGTETKNFKFVKHLKERQKIWVFRFKNWKTESYFQVSWIHRPWSFREENASTLIFKRKFCGLLNIRLGEVVYIGILDDGSVIGGGSTCWWNHVFGPCCPSFGSTSPLIKEDVEANNYLWHGMQRPWSPRSCNYQSAFLEDKHSYNNLPILFQVLLWWPSGSPLPLTAHRKFFYRFNLIVTPFFSNIFHTLRDGSLLRHRRTVMRMVSSTWK